MDEIKGPEETTGPTTPDVMPTITQPQAIPRAKALILYAIICILTLAEAWDATSIVIVIPAIAQSTHANATASYALGTSFLLANAIFQTLFAELSHTAGRKPMYLLALTLILVGSVIAGLSDTIAQMLAGRIIQGGGSAGGMVLAMVVLVDLFPLRERTLYIAGLNVLYTVGSVTGPVLGGVFLKFLSWRWIFWINLPLIGVALLGIVLLPESNKSENVTLKNLVHVNWAGLCILIPSSVAILLPITLGGVIYPWSSWRVIVPLILGIGGLVLFSCQQRYLAKRPIFPVTIFPDLGSIIFQLSAFIQGLLLWLFMYYIVLYFQGVRRLDGIHAGVYSLPATLTVAPAAIVSGIIISKTRHYRWSVRIGWTISTIGLGLLYLLGLDTRMVEIVLICIIVGLGIGTLLSTVMPGAQATLDRKVQPHAITLVMILRSAGQCLGVAVGTAVFSNTLMRQLAEINSMGETSITAESILQQLGNLGANAAEEREFRQAIVEALKPVWITACAVSAAMGLMCGMMKCPPLPEDHEVDMITPNSD